MSELIIQGTGYLASLLLALSLLVTDDLRFRWFNTGGCLAFIVYGILIGAFPVILTNSILFFINVFALVKIYRKKEAIDLVEFQQDDAIIRKFLQFYGADLKHFFPGFQTGDDRPAIRLAVLIDMVIAHVFVASLSGDGTGLVRLNYTIPKFRDDKIGRDLFEKEKERLLAQGIRKLVFTDLVNKHQQQFLGRLGFQLEIIDGRSCWVTHLGQGER